MAIILGSTSAEKFNLFGKYIWNGSSWVLASPWGTTSSSDIVQAGGGNDEVDGGGGDDVISGEAGNDLLIGGAGSDIVDGGSGNDTIYGGNATPNSSGSGNDILSGGSGQDTIYGGDGNDVIDGGSDNDELLGESGNDVISGGSGADLLTGGTGADMLAGGSGGDTYIYNAVADSQAGGNSKFSNATGDVISGFDSAAENANAAARDKIDLTGLAASIGHSLTWGNKTAGAYKVWYEVSGGNTYVNADTTGDGKADLVIKISGTETLSAADFIGLGPVDNIAPVVTSVAYGANDGTLKAGDTILLTVSFSEAVIVAGGTPTLTLNSGGVATYTGSGSGTSTLTFSYTVAAGQNAGDLAVTAFNPNSATIKDAAGNNANLSGAVIDPSGVVIVDTSAPAAPVVALAQDTGITDDHLTNDGALVTTGIEDGATVEYSTDGGITWLSSFTAQEGENTVKVRQTDAAGNVSAATDFDFTLDMHAPDAPVITGYSNDTGIPGDGITADTALSLTGTAEAHATVTIYDHDSQIGTTTADDSGAWTFETGDLSLSDHAFTATATDAAANVSGASDAVSITVVATTTGSMIDGYIAGATVFADANDNGVLDAGEVSTTTDAAGNFTLEGGSGKLVAVGGTDISTGQAFMGTLRAPEGASTITPLTTLVVTVAAANGLTDAEAQAAVIDALGLDPAIGDLGDFDPIAAALSNDPATAAAGAAAVAAAVTIQNTVIQAASLLEGAGASPAAAEGAVLAALALQISAGGPSLDLTDTAILTEIVSQAATESGANSLDTATIEGAATVIGAVNQVAATTAASATGAELLTGLAQVQIVVQTEITSSLAEAGENNDASSAVENYTEDALQDAVDDAADQVGDVDGGTTGTSDDDTLVGSAAGDAIGGGEGNDTISGEGGNDTLIGDEGNDTLTGGTGNDTLTGGAGVDTYVWHEGDGYDTILSTGSGGSEDVIRIEGTFYDYNWSIEGDDLIVGVTADNTYDFATVGGSLRLEDFFLPGHDSIAYLEADLGPDNNSFYSPDGGNARIYFSAVTGTDQGNYFETIIGTSGDDVMSDAGGTGGHWFAGLDGNDTITVAAGTSAGMAGGNGNDTLTGAELADDLRGGAGNDVMDGGDGIDRATYNRPADSSPVTSGAFVNLSGANAIYDFNGTETTIAAGTAIDNWGDTDTLLNIENVRGSNFDDVLVGSDGDNNLQGLAGNDILAGGAGYDALIGDNGDDVLDAGADDDWLAGGQGADTLIGGDGVDNVGYDTGSSGAFVNLSGQAATFDFNGTETTVAGGTAIDNGGATDTLSEIEDVWGSNFDDVIVGTSGANNLHGNDGDDILVAGGNDAPNGGDLDFLYGGGGGADSFVFGTETGDTHIEDFELGTDFLRLQGDVGIASLDVQIWDEPWGPTTIVTLTTGATIALVSVTGISDASELLAPAITGTTDPDTLTGTVFNDTLIGGEGNDTLTGGAGIDTYVWHEGDGYDTILSAGSGGSEDIIRIEGTFYDFDWVVDGDDLIVGVVADATYDFATTGGSLKLEDFFVPGNDSLGYLEVDVGANNQYYSPDGGVARIYFSAVNGTDQGNHFELIEGTSGNDMMTDVGGTGVNRFDGFDGDDTITVAAGTSGQMVGGNGNDTLTGAELDDTLRGAAGNDVMDGGDGTDLARYDLRSGSAEITSGAFVNLSDQAATYDFNGTSTTIAGGTAIDNYGGSDTLSNIEQVIGSDFDDVIVGTSGANYLQGNDGDDILAGGAGNDDIDGGDGNDIIIAGDNDGPSDDNFDNVSGGGGADSFVFGTEIGDTHIQDFVLGTDVLRFQGNVGIASLEEQPWDEPWGPTTIVTLTTGATIALVSVAGISDASQLLAPAITGTTDPDTLTGTVFNDTLIGGEGDDTLTGGAGVDTYVWHEGDGYDTILSAGSGGSEDIIRIEGTFYDFDWQYDGNDLLVGVVADDNYDFATTGGSMRLEDFFLPGHDSIDHVEVDLGESNGFYSPDGGDARIYVSRMTGTDQGNYFETILGTDGDDVMSDAGGAGPNYFYGRDGNDTINMAAGTFGSLNGGNGDDTLTGAELDDTLRGSAGNDTMDGGDGIDTVRYNGLDGSPATTSGAFVNLSGADATYDFNGGSETVAGGTAIDSWGDTDTLLNIENARGSDFNDVLVGNAGDNSLDGRAGHDILAGGAGADWLRGGQGADKFVFGTEAGDDFIDDFAVGIDILVLEGGVSIEGLTEFDSDGDDYDDSTLVTLSTGATIALNGVTGVGDANVLLTPPIIGTTAADMLTGSASDDTLIGDKGNDTLIGDAGSDTYVWSEGDGYDTILSTGSGGSEDVIRIEGTFYDFDWQYDGDDLLVGVVADDSYDLTSTGGNLRLEDFFIPGNDSIDYVEVDLGGNNGFYSPDGGDARIYVSRMTGTDQGNYFETILGTDGDNVMSDAGGVGPNYFYGRDGNDTITMAAGTFGSLNGDNGDDTLTGAELDDQLRGSAGNDTMNGGDGIDTVRYNSPGGSTPIVAGVFVNLSGADATYDFNGGSETVAGGTAIDSWSDTDTLSNIENVRGSNFDDVLVGSDADNNLEGLAGNDILAGGGGNDWMVGGQGADTLIGGDGYDNAAYDTGGSGAFVNLSGEDATFDFNGIETTIAGGTAIDNGGAADTLLEIEDVWGSDFADVIVGTSGGNNLHGNDGDDILVGGGNDAPNGGDLDFLYGGGGADIFVFGSEAGETHIHDFELGIDVLQLQDGVTIDTFVEFDDDLDTINDSTMLTLSTGAIVSLYGTSGAADANDFLV